MSPKGKSQNFVWPVFHILTIVVIVTTLFSKIGYSHEEIPVSIEEITEEISKDPENGKLYLRRAYFYWLQDDWETSLKDLDMADKFSKKQLTVVPLIRAKDWFTGSEITRYKKLKEIRLNKTLRNISLFEEREPEHPDSFKLKAEALAALGRYKEAVVVHRELINELNQNPGPLYYLTQIDWLIADGQTEEAAEFLKIGIKNLGPVELLLMKAKDLGITIQNNPILINDFVTFNVLSNTLSSTDDTTGCPGGCVGKFSFDARLTNISSSFFSNIAIEIAELANGNLILTSDGNLFGVGEQFDVALNDDGILSPGENIDVHLVLCVKEFAPFTLIEDVFAVVE
ncbi:MAG: hypothetical protein D8M57_14240 [Candidatus Scalindua sp. AMX11]|nr:MAG: hypothetical protein DWQ00_09515 [Candidatus Scalindua sp.]NOG83550.1 hypothetical protein [Planctomycetota bacterium]RZV70945.1 MAG: hypothetical protein EX341_15190 [Candidatus Scalindua sp. SCAELEC01]TDE64252.1 MAG: hypothetical protein D8M57_14240 [Candidatus Scalindua sp. AMX11]GJQ59954.1 MAG: hypothetical protein SCALA701_27550 [Candidatus Scalindua sp.]